ncbi:MAG: hypothetical protein LBQ14_06375 [Treponema sp.]|jgi:hypothetical protein|nr:hypothetical protein [Treponema sp.]
MKKAIGWLLAILLVILCIIGSKCTSVSIGGETVKAFRNDTPFFRRKRYEDSTTRFLRDQYWSGRTRNSVAIRTSSGTIALPKGSSIDKTQGVIGPAVYVLSGEGIQNDLTLFGNVIDRPLYSVSVTSDGEIMGFSVRGGAVKMEVGGVVFQARLMERRTRFDHASAHYEDPYKQYVYFDCTGMEPLRIDGSSGITFTGDGEEKFTMTIEENDYGFYVYALTSLSEKSFLVEHPSLDTEIRVNQVRFDRLYDKIVAYKINPGDEETLISYEESTPSLNGKPEGELFAELLREALWRAQNEEPRRKQRGIFVPRGM